MTAPILLDTCALIWISQGDPIRPEARASLDRLWIDGGVPLVSPITAWEISLLVRRGRLALTMSPTRWWSTTLSRLGLELAPMSPSLLIASNELPGDPPNDPADRIIAATAREHGVRLMTRDRLLVAYGQAGHLDVQAC